MTGTGRNLEAMMQIVHACYERRRSISRRAWRHYASETARDPEILNCVHRCKMTRRSYERPRGYAGDAVMLDHIYSSCERRFAPYPATTEGQVYAYTVNAPAPRAVRFRRATLARLIDEAADRTGTGNASVASIACGHLREVDLSHAMQSRWVGHFFQVWPFSL